MSETQDGRVEATLARPIIQGGVERAAGERVRLRPDQVERLRAQGAVAAAPGGRGGGKKKEDG